MAETKDKLTIMFFSGTMDKALAMLILSTTAASLGMEVVVFVTFWGLNFLKKDKIYRKKNLLSKMMEFVSPKNMSSLPLSNMNMLGVGPAMMKKMMRSTKCPGIEELFALATQLKVKFYACSTSCGVMGLEKENLLDNAEIVGAATYLNEAKNSKVSLFI
jgi:peroxiredoxin family protein